MPLYARENIPCEVFKPILNGNCKAHGEQIRKSRKRTSLLMFIIFKILSVDFVLRIILAIT